jgi:hypothetical protein
MPFAQVDDFLNQSEDAVILGYRVLERTVEEIKNGYKDAQEFNRKREEFESRQRAYERNPDGPPPAPPEIPWTKLVTRAQNLQEFALQAVKDGTDIFIDSVRSGMESAKSLAKTWQDTRNDLDAKPTLAGPVFEEEIVITAYPGQTPAPEKRRIRHRGLARLRIHAEVNPLQELQPFGADSAKGGPLYVNAVTFQPQDPAEDEEFSELTVDVGKIPADQRPAEYAGLITAKNFQLLIASLRVRVVEPETRASQASDETAAAPRPARVSRPAPSAAAPRARSSKSRGAARRRARQR